MTRPHYTPKRLPRTSTSDSEFNKDERKQAWAAVQKLQSMLPQLRHFARSVTGNPKLDIKITAGVPQTRGNTITIRPPMGLGKDYRHNRSKCGTRNSDGQQACKACRVREVIEFFLFHEIAHVAFKTQEAPTNADHIVVEKYITEWHPTAACDHSFTMRALTMDPEQAPDPQNLGRLMNAYLSIINNCLEDARVNARTFDARPGLRTVFDLNIEKLMTEGTEVGVDKYVQWTEAPLDSQFMVGLNMLASGYPYEGRFAPSVVEALGDERLQSLCARAVGSNDVHDIFALSVEVFRRAQVLGFCLVPKCQVPEPVVPDPPQPSADTDGEASGDQDESDESDPDGGTESGKSDDDSATGGEFGENEQGTASGGLRSDDGGTDESDEDGTDSDEPADDADSDSTDSDSDESGDSPDQLGDGTSADGAESEVSSGRPSGIDPSTHDDAADEADGPAGSGRHQEDNDGDEDIDSDAGRDGESRSDEDGSDQGTPGSGSTPGRDEDEPGADVEGGEDSDSDSGRDTEVESEVSDSHDGADGGTDDDDSDDADADDDLNPWGDLNDEFDGDGDGRQSVVENPWDVAAPEDPSPLRGTEPPNEPPSAPGDGLTAPELEPGTPEDIGRAIARFLMHGTDEADGLLDSLADGDIEDMVGLPLDEAQELPERIKELIIVALAQVAYFDDASRYVAGVEEVPYPNSALKWTDIYDWKEFAAPESLVGRAVLIARRVFDDNKRGKHLKNLKSGRVNTRALGRRAPFGDARVFERKIIPGKKSYFVVVGGDCSGSTDSYERNPKIKRAIMAQGDLLTRLGIKWAGYMHTAYTRPINKIRTRGGQRDPFYVYILPFKKPEEAWNDKTKNKLANVVAFSDNLDGHTLQYYRKVAEKSDATTKIIIYYTDGAMPAANYDEERELLEKELALCKKKGIIVIAVGINTDSPKQYGMDTARVDSDEDLHKVVDLLERHLIEKELM